MSYRISKAEERALDELPFTRKPDSLDDVEQVAFSSLSPVQARALAALDEVGSEVLGKFLLSNFSQPMPRFFKLRAHGRTFLVNTEGYQYPRYMLEVRP